MRFTGIGFASPLTLALCAALFAAPAGWAQPLHDGDGTSVTCDDYNIYGNAYFGDTHVHTKYSVDAFSQGTNTTPDQAYRFAKGEQIGFHPFDEQGEPTRFGQIDRPLDFAVVADHAELFGERSICLDDTHPLYDDPSSAAHCEALRLQDGSALIPWNSVLGAKQDKVKRFTWCGTDGSICTSQLGDTWQEMQDAAAYHYDTSTECSFTTFVGYEWTGAPTGFTVRGLETLNLHRNVIFRNSIVPDRPNTYLDNGYPENLWNSLQAECIDAVDPQGQCDVLAIPHNSNLSQGKIFEVKLPNGQPYGSGKAWQRVKMEPLIEIMQHKGQSECLATSADELCDFETIPWGHLAGNFIPATEPQVEGTVRDALKKGLVGVVGFNTFQYGLIGSTDTHLGAAGDVQESADYLGHGGAAGGADGATVFTGVTDTPEFNPGGLAVVWAPQNSRAALFDAMKRREVYATSGPRHIVRFYGSWNLPENICSDPNMVQVAYNNAVPMGARLRNAGPGQTEPRFLVFAQKDPLGNDLQRIQIIKGWQDAQGGTHEEVIDVIGGDNGAGVDLETCEATGAAGSEQLCEVWVDPDFDATEKAFYYARVVENPSCRWSHRQCLAAPEPIDCNADPVTPAGYAACCNVDVPKTVQERSWASPIWYNPPPAGC